MAPTSIGSPKEASGTPSSCILSCSGTSSLASSRRGPAVGGVVGGGVDEGRRFAVRHGRPCGTCELCLEGNRNLCLSVRFAGHGGDDGALRDYLAWPTALLHTVPDAL